jgi:uncharacterized protein YqgC (DUF456 family)
MSFVVAAAFGVLALFCVGLVLLGVPGTWAMLLGAVGIELVDGAWLAGADPTTFGWGLLAVAAVFAAFGEGVDLISGVVGARKAGASRTGVAASFVGTVLGALAGTWWIPIPLVGSLIGALFGTFAGALGGEALVRSEPREAVRPAVFATVGRLAGTAVKAGIGGVIWAVLLGAALIP